MEVPDAVCVSLAETRSRGISTVGPTLRKTREGWGTPREANVRLKKLFLLSVFICVYLWIRFLLVFHAPRRLRMAKAASLARSPRSPAGPTQDGQPFSQGQAAISSRVLASSR
jgi:hypothetical protein